jgi:hypothetical protein
MKKFAVLAVAGFMASSMLACSDEPEDEGDSSSSGEQPSAGSNWTLSDLTGSQWTLKKTVTLGSVNHATLGSFLDIDGTIDASGNGSSTVYTVSGVSSHKNDIDLIYDGTNLFSPTGCLGSCPTSLKNALTGSTSDAMFHTLPSSVTPSTSACQIHSLVPGNSSTIQNVITVAQKGIYYVQTNEGSRALVLIGEKNDAANTIELIIGYIYSLNTTCGS